MSQFDRRLAKLEETVGLSTAQPVDDRFTVMSDEDLDAHLSKYPPELLELSRRTTPADRLAYLEHRMRDMSDEGLDLFYEIDTRFFGIPWVKESMAEWLDRNSRA